MNGLLVIGPSGVGLEFGSEEDRDLFFQNMATREHGEFSPQVAAEKRGRYFISLNIAAFPVDYTWRVAFAE
jgi:hypothetical protein